MNFANVKEITIPEGKAVSIAINGVDVWKAVDKYTWEAVLASIDAGTYATDYAIGDMVPLDLGGEGLINMQIAAFDKDDLADGSGKAPITWVAKEVLKSTARMNRSKLSSTVVDGNTVYTEGTGSIGGWEKSYMRTYLKETIKPLIPLTVRNAIKEVKKKQPAYNTNKQYTTQNTVDDVWIPSKDELSSSNYYGLLFTNQASQVKYTTDGNYAVWWLRQTDGAEGFIYVSSNGNADYGSSAEMPRSVCLCFCT